ncbi:MAG: hypothetical protein AVDCRST_MAG35-1154 [uncultured Quadrisphaera sp.]|uniref:Uncharacterized protein n=1 Tax=uncultured Quadrisphaera sp. TaxID=904978 RepID=A0A6J4PBV4_9ACTN|nr:MAG: hypothetical protein AVDCRST_MAG35-1154 [uncultured Quadrisphaera sp.]
MVVSAAGERPSGQRPWEVRARPRDQWSLGALALLLFGLLAMHGSWGVEAGAAHHPSPSFPVAVVEHHPAHPPSSMTVRAGAGSETHQEHAAGHAHDGGAVATCLLALTGVVTLLAAVRRRSPAGWAGRRRAARPSRVPLPRDPDPRPGRGLGTALCVMRV